MSFPKKLRREQDNGNLDDFKVFRGNSSQGISQVQDVVKKKTKAVKTIGRQDFAKLDSSQSQ